MCLPNLGGAGNNTAGPVSPAIQQLMKPLMDKLKMQRIAAAQQVVNSQVAMRPADAAQMASALPVTGRSAVDLRIPLR